MASLAGFGKLCRDAAKAAAERGRPVLASWSAITPQFTVVDRVRHLSAGSERTFVWASSWSGQRRLAVGTALDVTAQGADRFEQVSASWQRCRSGALIGGTGRRPSLVGGFSFRHHDHDEAGGRAAMPDALMWLPTAELIEEPGGATVLTLNAWLRPDVDVSNAVGRAANAARTLVADSAVAGSGQPRVVSMRETPLELEWKLLVRRVLDAIAADSFEKLVLARQLALDFDRPVAVAPMLASLLDDHQVGAVFGAQVRGQWFVGRTPECLLHLRGERVETHGLAGSVPRDPDPVRDAQLSRHLQTDPKLAREHAIVAHVVKQTLQRFFRDVRTDAAESVLQIADIQHRQTRISAARPRSAPDLLRLAGALHPTPAVGGFPAIPALRCLTASEPFDRGWYAAPIGWFDADASGELAVGIRSATIKGASAVVYAGCGIVEGSDPDEEYDETRVKMRSMLKALGVCDDVLVTR
jgi:salicylate biosynthesis isochorismate synthase